jgi:hypothetical protein
MFLSRNFSVRIGEFCHAYRVTFAMLIDGELPPVMARILPTQLPTLKCYKSCKKSYKSCKNKVENKSKF